MTSTPVEVGTLIVVVLKARNLPNKRHIGKQDPYCSVKLNNETRRTKAVKRGGQHPEWDEEVRFTIFEDVEDELARTAGGEGLEGSPPPPPPKKDKKKLKGGKKMQLMCYADDPREPDLIGETMVDLTEVLTKGETDEWFTLTNKEKYCGEVYLELTFWSNEKPPEKRSTPQASAFHPQYGGPGSFTPSTDLPASLMHGGASHHTPSPSRIPSSSGTDAAPPPSLRPSLSLAQVNLYSAPYEQHNRPNDVDQLSGNFTDLGVNPTRRRESLPPGQVGPSEFGYTGGATRPNGSVSMMSPSGSLSSIHSLGPGVGSRHPRSSLSPFPESFTQEDYPGGLPHNMAPMSDGFAQSPFHISLPSSAFVQAPAPSQTPLPSQFNVPYPSPHSVPSGFPAPQPPPSAMSFHPPQPQPHVSFIAPPQTPFQYPAYAQPHMPGQPHQYTLQDGSLPPPSVPLASHASPQQYGQHATPPPPPQGQLPPPQSQHPPPPAQGQLPPPPPQGQLPPPQPQGQLPPPPHNPYQQMPPVFPTPQGSRPLPTPQPQPQPRPEQLPPLGFTSPPPGPAPPVGPGNIVLPNATPFQPPGPPPPPPPRRRISVPPTPTATQTSSLSYTPPPPPPLPPQNGVHRLPSSHLHPPPPPPPPPAAQFHDHPSPPQPYPTQQLHGHGSWVPPPPPPPPISPLSGFSGPPVASTDLPTPLPQNQQQYPAGGQSISPVKVSSTPGWNQPPPQQYPPQHIFYGSQDGWHQ